MTTFSYNKPSLATPPEVTGRAAFQHASVYHVILPFEQSTNHREIMRPTTPPPPYIQSPSVLAPPIANPTDKNGSSSEQITIIQNSPSGHLFSNDVEKLGYGNSKKRKPFLRTKKGIISMVVLVVVIIVVAGVIGGVLASRLSTRLGPSSATSNENPVSSGPGEEINQSGGQLDSSSTSTLNPPEPESTSTTTTTTTTTPTQTSDSPVPSPSSSEGTPTTTSDQTSGRSSTPPNSGSIPISGSGTSPIPGQNPTGGQSPSDGRVTTPSHNAPLPVVSI